MDQEKIKYPKVEDKFRLDNTRIGSIKTNCPYYIIEKGGVLLREKTPVLALYIRGLRKSLLLLISPSARYIGCKKGKSLLWTSIVKISVDTADVGNGL